MSTQQPSAPVSTTVHDITLTPKGRIALVGITPVRLPGAYGHRPSTVHPRIHAPYVGWIRMPFTEMLAKDIRIGDTVVLGLKSPEKPLPVVYRVVIEQRGR